MVFGREMPGYPYNLKAKFTRCLVAGRRIVFGKYLARFSSHSPLPVCAKGQAANDLIRSMIESPSPCLVARYGSGEMEAVLRGIDITRGRGGILRILTGEGGPFWWDNSIRAGLCWNAGFFPPDDEAMSAFSRRVCADSSQIDLLGSWLPGEKYMARHFAPQMRSVPLADLEPFFFKEPWTGALAGKNVLVVHPFENTIRMQYAKRKLLFEDGRMLPEFNLKTYRTVSSFGGCKTTYATWFDALDAMCEDIAKIDFDAAVIGCGAYGLSIGAFIKRELGKKAVHLGGVTQVLFGIKGKRFDTRSYATKLYNENWVRPLASDIVASAKTIEGGCYW